MIRHLASSILLIALLSTSSASAQLISDLVNESSVIREYSRATLGKTDQVVYQTDDLGSAYNGILFQGFYYGDQLNAEVRFFIDQSFSDWYPARVIRSASDDGSFAGGYRGDEYFEGGKFQVRFVSDSGSDVQLIAAGSFDNRLDEISPAGNGLIGKKTSGTTTVQPPPLITRQEWNADPYIRGDPSPLAPDGVQYMTFHHAAGFSATSREEGLAQLKAIQDLHQNIRGWSDIGYQFVIDKGGRVYQGRPFLDGSTTLEEIPALARGAHVGGANTGNIGICLLGCYHPPEGGNCVDQITSESLDSYITTFAFLSEAYEVEPEQIRGHRDFSPTSCPGDNNYVLLPQIIDDVSDVIQFGNAQPEAYSLERNFPNPVDGSTTFRYFLKESGVVSLKVFDLAGREIAQVQNEFLEGPRWHAVEFDASNLASGMYYYRISVEGFAGVVYDRARSLVVVSP
ncbi:MAG: T9SS type A sorting domain-containing protein [Rhodothermales bacterium]|nr:T9SS type A sorting domain-containing protein [Rhodothermales bacterium]